MHCIHVIKPDRSIYNFVLEMLLSPFEIGPAHLLLKAYCYSAHTNPALFAPTTSANDRSQAVILYLS